LTRFLGANPFPFRSKTHRCFNPGKTAMDVLVVEFIGMAMVALCIIVLACPSRDPSSSRRRADY
jgi:hypothetical protein